MTHSPCAAVTYRASDGDRDLAMLLAIDPARATLSDAWERLTAAFGTIDPTSIEIEIRQRRQPPSVNHCDCGRVLPGRWPDVRSLDAC
jgi:hypothetical protein